MELGDLTLPELVELLHQVAQEIEIRVMELDSDFPN